MLRAEGGDSDDEELEDEEPKEEEDEDEEDEQEEEAEDGEEDEDEEVAARKVKKKGRKAKGKKGSLSGHSWKVCCNAGPFRLVVCSRLCSGLHTRRRGGPYADIFVRTPL